MIREQLPVRKQLAETETTDFLDRYNLAGTYAYIGSLLMQTGDVQGALENQQEALRIRETLVALDPNKARAQRALTHLVRVSRPRNESSRRHKTSIGVATTWSRNA